VRVPVDLRRPVHAHDPERGVGEGHLDVERPEHILVVVVVDRDLAGLELDPPSVALQGTDGTGPEHLDHLRVFLDGLPACCMRVASWNPSSASRRRALRLTRPMICQVFSSMSLSFREISSFQVRTERSRTSSFMRTYASASDFQSCSRTLRTAIGRAWEKMASNTRWPGS